MAETRCPDCGAPISPAAVVCPTCGFPLRPDLIARGGAAGRGSTGNVAGIVIGLVVGGFVVVVVIGILAALAIPRFAQATARAREKNGEALLRNAWTAERIWHANHGEYTAQVDELDLPPPSGPRHYALEVSAASDRDLCLEAVPAASAGSGTRALSMDAQGMLYRSAGCTGESAGPPGASGEEGAVQMLREVHEGIVAYHAEHGEYPRSVSDVVSRVHDSPAGQEYQISLVDSGPDGVCAVLFPRSPFDGLRALSVDQDGNLYHSPACAGEPVDHFAAPADGAAPSDAVDEKPVKPVDKPVSSRADDPGVSES